MLHAPLDPEASVTFTDPSLLMRMGEQRNMRRVTPTSQGLGAAAVGRSVRSHFARVLCYVLGL